MSWSKHPSRSIARRSLLLLGSAAILSSLSGCLRPMLAEGGTSDTLRGQIALPAISDRLSRAMSVRLEKRLGEPVATPLYRLEVSRNFERRGLLVTQDNDITRIQLRGTAEWRLFRRGELEPVDKGVVSSEGGYDQTASLFASRTTERDVERRLAEDMAERIARRLLARADRYIQTG
ncbi:MAG: LPS assembly lipoprotein LptE [Pseudomonadota bacterium]